MSGDGALGPAAPWGRRDAVLRRPVRPHPVRYVEWPRRTVTLGVAGVRVVMGGGVNVAYPTGLSTPDRHRCGGPRAATASVSGGRGAPDQRCRRVRSAGARLARPRCGPPRGPCPRRVATGSRGRPHNGERATRAASATAGFGRPPGPRVDRLDCVRRTDHRANRVSKFRTASSGGDARYAQCPDSIRTERIRSAFTAAIDAWPLLGSCSNSTRSAGRAPRPGKQPEHILMGRRDSRCEHDGHDLFHGPSTAGPRSAIGPASDRSPRADTRAPPQQGHLWMGR